MGGRPDEAEPEDDGVDPPAELVRVAALERQPEDVVPA